MFASSTKQIVRGLYYAYEEPLAYAQPAKCPIENSQHLFSFVEIWKVKVKEGNKLFASILKSKECSGVPIKNYQAIPYLATSYSKF
jgi:hypothetical protein